MRCTGWGRSHQAACQPEPSHLPAPRKGSTPDSLGPALPMFVMLLSSRAHFFRVISQDEAIFCLFVVVAIGRSMWGRKESLLLKKHKTYGSIMGIFRNQLRPLLIIWVLKISLWIILISAVLFLWKLLSLTFHWLLIVPGGSSREEGKVVKL